MCLYLCELSVYPACSRPFHVFAKWIIQKNQAWDSPVTAPTGIEGHAGGLKFLIPDREAKFTAALDAVFTAIGVRIIATPVRAPRANAIAERWIASARRECMDQMLVTSERHLQLVPGEYIDIDHYNTHRPRRALEQRPPAGCLHLPL